MSVRRSARTSLSQRGVTIIKTLQLRHRWADVDDTWHV